jgi:AcrR family transcriptional regulator
MTQPKPNKHQVRTKETRELLLRAAEEVFVREGYAGAELGEIASIAGRTKGAIYAQFESKEDIFMALVEDHALHYRSDMEKALANSTSVEQNRATFKRFCLKLSGNYDWNLLMLEFKLFAIRHPEAKIRYRKFIAKMIPPDAEKRLTGLLGGERKGKQALGRSISVQLIQPLLSALTLEVLFDPDVLSERTRDKVTERLFEALVDPADESESEDRNAAKLSDRPREPHRHKGTRQPQ